jgi:hypothetical protein
VNSSIPILVGFFLGAGFSILLDAVGSGGGFLLQML